MSNGRAQAPTPSALMNFWGRFPRVGAGAGRKHLWLVLRTHKRLDAARTQFQLRVMNPTEHQFFFDRAPSNN
jgi:hypothetical protein